MTRIAKHIANAGICSRRAAEKLISDGRVKINGEIILTPALTVKDTDVVLVDGVPLELPHKPRLWIFYKPTGVITTHKDPQERQTLFQLLPSSMPRVISIGRLDLNSEGLILLTTSGAMSRYAELPSTGWQRCYRVRVYGDLNLDALDSLKKGITIEGVRYGKIEVDIIKDSGRNSWLYMVLKEGKNREIRRILQYFGLHVNRLIRMAYGPFSLENLKPGELKEISYKNFSPHFPCLISEKNANHFRKI